METDRLSHALKWTFVPCAAQVERKRKKAEYGVKYIRDRRSRDPAFKILSGLRGRINSAVRRHGTQYRKSGRTREMLGCTLDQLMQHLESKFDFGMTWQNYGEWHVDHIRPCASFDLTKEVQQWACFHFTNLQPLWAEENHWKSDRWQPPAPAL